MREDQISVFFIRESRFTDLLMHGSVELLSFHTGDASTKSICIWVVRR